MITRTRNHRRNGCGTCTSITQAHYYLTKHDNALETIKELKEMGVLCRIVRSIPVFIFSDGSYLAYTEKRGLHKVDNLLRKTIKTVKRLA